MHKVVLRFGVCLVLWLTHAGFPDDAAWPEPSSGRPAPTRAAAAFSPMTVSRPHFAEPARDVEISGEVDEVVQKIPICIAWTQRWAGELGRTVLFRARRDEANRLHVGYFAYWSTERPWGDNLLTRAVVPALLIDAVYSHFLLVFPGLQALMYGAGDVEGFRVVYERASDGAYRPVAITADDESHGEVELDPREAVDSAGRVVVLDDIWSHQLGGHDAAQALGAGAESRCFEAAALQRMTPAIADAFRLGSPANPRRAGPAWLL